MSGMGGYDYSLRFRDTMKEMIRGVIDKERPKYRYATVISVDSANSRALITYVSETTEVYVNIVGLTPLPGEAVQISGQGSDKFISGIVGHAPSRLGPRVQSGVEYIAGVAMNGSLSPKVAITFASAFSAKPHVTFECTNGRLTLTASNVSTTGFELGADNWSTGSSPGSVPVYWRAVQD